MMSAQYAAHRVLLRRAISRLTSVKVATVTMRPGNQQVDNMVSNMLDGQSVSEDHCPTELAGAQHDLTVLHQNIEDLASQVNASEAQIQSTTDSLNNVHDEMTRTNHDLDTAVAKCQDEEQEAEKMLDELRSQLSDMQQLGNQGVDQGNLLDVSKQMSPAPRVGGLLQQASGRPHAAKKHAAPKAGARKPMSITDAKAHVAKTKHMAQNLASCVARVTGKPVASLGQIAPRFQSQRRFGTQDGALSQEGQGQQPQMCRNTTRIQIRLGGMLKVITPGTDLQNGDIATHPCSDINPAYAVGTIQMTCQNGYVDVDMSACRLSVNHSLSGPTPEQCAGEREELDEQYEESYKKIAEEISEFEAEVASTTCEDTANQNHQQRITPPQTQQAQLSQTLTDQTGQLQSYRTQLQDAADTEADLRGRIADIASRCETIDEVTESLDRVRDAIHILDLCPGLGRLDFTLPQFVGSWVVLDVEADLRDAEIDAEMYTMCRGLESGGGVPRPAETAEIQQSAVDGAPESNTATVPLMGTCPGCEGTADSESGVSHPSGHARICWDPDATLNEDGRREDCGHGRKAIMCVLDRHQ
jgi:predicted nuclease with TOPRIM domain